jgi:WD40 repeat protein
MFNIYKSLKVKGSILAIEIFENYIAVLDNLYNIYFVESKTFDIKKDYNISTEYEPFHQFSKAFALSKNGYMAMSINNSNKVLILYHKSYSMKKIVAIGNHQRVVESVEFSKNSKFMATGGADGRVFVFDTKYYKSLTSVEKQSDSISCIAFSEDSNKLVSNSFNRTSIIFDLDRNKEIGRFETGTVVEDAKFYDEDKKIIVCTRDGMVIQYDIEKQEIISEQSHCEHWPSVVIITPYKDYAIIGTRESVLYFVRLKDNTLMSTLSLNSTGVTHLTYFKNFLVAGFYDGGVKLINTLYKRDEFEAELKLKKYAKLKTIIEENRFILLTPLVNKFYEAWPAVLKEAIDMVANDEIDEAIQHTNPFMDDPEKAKEFEFYLAQKAHVKKLSDLIKRKKYIRAFQLCEKEQSLKDLALYKELELHWSMTFKKARKLLEQNSSFNASKANQLLEPFKQVRSKELIVRNLLDNTNKFAEADEMIKGQKFGDYFMLVDKFEFLKETDLYKKVIMLLDRFYSQSVSQIQSEKYDEALKTLSILRNIHIYADRVEDLIVDIDFKIKLKRAYETKDAEKIFQIAHEYPQIKLMLQYKEIEQAFNHRCELAKPHAFAGKPKQVLKILSEYQQIEYTLDKVAGFVKIAYIAEIEKAVKNQQNIDWGYTLANYVKFFGKDDEISTLYSNNHKDSFLDNIQETANGKEGYKINSFVETVIEFAE